jgi:Delta24(24(1))-sterol reductase
MPPRKPDMPDMIETPGTTRRSSRRVESDSVSPPQPRPRRSRAKKEKEETPEQSDNAEEEESIAVAAPRASKMKQKGEANGSAATPEKRPATVSAKKAHRKTASLDHKIDSDPHFEFGGTPGVTAMMIGFPLLMYYMWIGATYYNGKPPLPQKGESMGHFFRHLGHLAYTGAFPSLKAWAIYWGFFIFEVVCYIVLPGVTVYGKQLSHEGGRQLEYHCSGVYSFWTTVAVATALHTSGLFKLYTWIDEFGPIMSVAIISGFVVSIVAYASALWRGAEHRMTGSPIYDFFMGAELNPRLFGILDFKMFFEVRIPWYILFLTSTSAAVRQYEQYGYVSGEVGFLVMAHFLYANACSKGEHYIPTTWDMYYEKWGFMLIFWNLAGVPLSYCHCTIYLANHAPETYRWNRAALVVLYAVYLTTYWVWDTSNSQKNYFRQAETGKALHRKAFPVLPWEYVENPRVIRSKSGHTLLADGWYRRARKIQYTCDFVFAMSWALVTGFNSPFPWFYPLFFACMIVHRASRDIQRCRVKYGDAWTEYERTTPYLFVPVSRGSRASDGRQRLTMRQYVF